MQRGIVIFFDSAIISFFLTIYLACQQLRCGITEHIAILYVHTNFLCFHHYPHHQNGSTTKLKEIICHIKVFHIQYFSKNTAEEMFQFIFRHLMVEATLFFWEM